MVSGFFAAWEPVERFDDSSTTITPLLLPSGVPTQKCGGWTVTASRFWYSFYSMLEFEFDPAKSVANRDKHGIDFIDAQAQWRDVHRIEVPARETDEPRWMVIGQIDGRVWSAVVTYRGEFVRIISVRPSREGEAALYEG
ncbi:MAG: uncharacterized protein QG655_2750 [Actinomycetota bacterium]|nr:uncharacterized protein [Actinomycetota bacterium]